MNQLNQVIGLRVGGALLLLLLLIGVLHFSQRGWAQRTSASSSNTTATTSAAKEWEYLIVGGGRANLSGGDVDPRFRKQPDDSFAREAYALEKNMDKLGQKGWELVAVSGAPSDPVFYFKRLKAER